MVFKISVPTTKVKVTIEGQRFVTHKLFVHNNSKQLKLIKCRTKVKHNEKVCRAQNLGFHEQGQGHIHRLFAHPLQIMFPQ